MNDLQPTAGWRDYLTLPNFKYVKRILYMFYLKFEFRICFKMYNLKYMRVKSLLKWVGGKGKYIDDILKYFPKEMDNYHELFLGGGSVLLGLLTLYNNKQIIIKNKIYASDLNNALIHFYKNVQSNPSELYETCVQYEEQYKTHQNKEQYYYEMRDKYNCLKNYSTIDASALFVFLNKTGFRGMYRVGPKGFNVPFGNYKNPTILNKTDLYVVSELIQSVIFIISDFKDRFQNINKNDFVYLDPPYYPIKQQSFVKYNLNGFNDNEHTHLFKQCRLFKEQSIIFVLNNSNAKYVRDYFDGFEIITYMARRSINAKKPESEEKEILITYSI